MLADQSLVDVLVVADRVRAGRTRSSSWHLRQWSSGWAVTNASPGARMRAPRYAVVNVPVARVLSTPLTWLMRRAARGPLSILSDDGDMAVHCGALGSRASPPPSVPHASGPFDGSRFDRLFAALGIVRRPSVQMRRRASTRVVLSATPGQLSSRTASAAHVVPRIGARLARDAFRATPREGLVAVAADATWTSRRRQPQLRQSAAATLGMYGATPDPMPNLSALAATALVFDDAYAVPLSIKGLFSGTGARIPGVRQLAAEEYAGVRCQPIASLLSRAGDQRRSFIPGGSTNPWHGRRDRNRGYYWHMRATSAAATISSFGV